MARSQRVASSIGRRTTAPNRRTVERRGALPPSRDLDKVEHMARRISDGRITAADGHGGGVQDSERSAIAIAAEETQ